ncbi:ABC transporter substrate-binding protein [Roseomonas marmotae]|uniref:ABC transporter substrate-binding protein n=2 Tax=Roseomonas marmotae TaxID=2768161 RepID=A0ABS3K7K1_9PROT|nr:ABC transporter substrate-binding protein [Roseomonas marmotae]QTI80855.1 ABC transporter substrate-binding protein [Roseomonas marmotae]
MGLTSAAAGLPLRRVQAQSRAESLRVLTEAGPNSFDPIGIGVNRYAIGVHWNAYDRLVRFGTKARPDGTLYYDYFTIEGELAERFEVSEEGTGITFFLRPDATFHDGSPVTAEDVKWSLDRVVSMPIGRPQFATGSMTSPDQFTVIDAHTIRVTTPRPDRFTLPNLAATFPVIFNSRMARAHATPTDPWASDWLRTHVAGGGAFRLENHQPGQSVMLSRFDDWKSGPLPGFRRVLWQVVPNAQSRRISLERGDADVAQDLLPQDAVSMAQEGQVKVVGAPMAGAFHFIGMNSQKPPFDKVKVRQAIAHALPYRQMFEAALFRRGQPLFGGRPDGADGTLFPQPLGYDTDPARARALLAEAGFPDGFETSFSFELSLATVAEPVSLLVQEALGRIGIKVTIDKVPGGQMGTLLERKELPFFYESSAAFLSAPDYFFRIFYHGSTRWNFGSYHNEEFRTLVERSRYETDEAAYDADVRRMIALAKQDVPIILLWQPALDTGMQKNVEGYKYLFHRMLDMRTLKRT